MKSVYVHQVNGIVLGRNFNVMIFQCKKMLVDRVIVA